MAFRNATIINNNMHKDSHSIFEAYVLAKSVEKQQLNEGLFGDFFKNREIEQQNKERFQTYKDLWTRFWYPRFANKKEINTNSEKANEVFEDFLNERQWAPNIEKNKEKALEYFKQNHGDLNFERLQKNAIEILLFGRASDDPYAQRVSDEPKTKLISKEGPAIKMPGYKGISKDEYDKLAPDEKSKGFKKPADYDKTADQAATEPAAVTDAEPEEDVYKLKGDITRWKKQNERWIQNIKKKFGVKVRKPSDLLRKK